MAYTNDLKDGESVQQWKGKPEEGIWFGYEPNHVPYAQPGKPGDSGKKEKSDSARAHLGKAIAFYEKALALKPKDANIVRLGLAWCQMEAGEKQKAIEGFRAVIAEAWKSEGKQELGGLREFVASEAIAYLVPLLDDAKDKAEIADLGAKKEKLESLPRPITPIAIPLRDGLAAADLIDQRAAVAFDLDATGRADWRWQWITADAAWLVFDGRQSGQVTSAIQLFGSRSFNLFFENGYEALALLDDNADGELRGDELAGIALWRDRNADGISDPGEVRPAFAEGIAVLRCDATDSHPRGVEWQNGTCRPTYDLILSPSGAPAAR
ncbi:MAG: tetratricopeptide repeat protein [Verrucomicrobiales bacterium]